MNYKPFQSVVWSHILGKVISYGRGKLCTDSSNPHHEAKTLIKRGAWDWDPGVACVCQSAKGVWASLSAFVLRIYGTTTYTNQLHTAVTANKKEDM